VQREQEPYHHEVLWIPASWWALGMLLVAAVWWAFFVAGPPALAWAAGGVALGGVLAGLVPYGKATVTVDTAGFRAGPAFLPWRYVGTAVPLDADQTRRTLGVEADARAFLLTRPYVKCAVKVSVDDHRDPTPYWLVSTRKPAEVAARLNARVMQD
jgi:hypothetical protein